MVCARMRNHLPVSPIRIALLIVCFSILKCGVARAATVTQFSPHGTVKNVRQVTARFSGAMTPLGDPRVRVSPFDIDCGQKASARWIDSFTWSYDFAADLPAGIKCTFTVHPGLKTLDGQTIEGTQSFSFDTGGPSIVESRPWESSEDLTEDQAFLVILDAVPEETSILANASFSVEGVAERVGVTVLGGADRDLLAKHFERSIDKRPFVILQARQHFPDGAKITLVWGKGIKSASGIATAEDQDKTFKVRPAFEAKVTCERENAKGGCIPLTPIRVYLTSSIARDVAQRIMLVAPDGTQIAPKSEEYSETNSVEFAPPFKESTEYKVTLPDHLIDDSGRTLANASRFPYPVKFAQFPSLAKFSARFGIIESVDPVLPITVRNLEAQIHGAKLKLDATTGAQGSTLNRLVTRVEATLLRMNDPDPQTILSWLQRVAKAKRTESVFGTSAGAGQSSFEIPKPNGPNAFEVMGIPLKSRG